MEKADDKVLNEKFDVLVVNRDEFLNFRKTVKKIFLDS